MSNAVELATLTIRKVRHGNKTVDGPLVITTGQWTGAANRAWRAIKNAKLHIWDTGPGKIEVVQSNDASVKSKVIAALEGAGFIVDDQA